MQQLKNDVQLLRLLQQPGYELIPCQPHWYRLSTPSKTDAYKLISTHSDTLTRWAEVTYVYVTYGNNVISIKGNAMTDTDSSNPLIALAIGGAMKPTLPIIRAMEMMVTDRDNSYGLVRQADERQIVLNGGASGRFLVGADIDEATQWARADYWHSLDLADFNRDWRQQMTPNDGVWHEYRYRCFDPKAQQKGDDFCNAQFINAFQLIDDGCGNLYHLGRNIDRIELN